MTPTGAPADRSPPLGWILAADRRDAYLYSARGEAFGTIRCQRDLRPLQPAGQILRALLSEWPSARSVQRGSIARLLTAEGEFAALVEAVVRPSQGPPAWLVVGIVFGDEAFTLIEGRTRHAAELGDLRRQCRRLLDQCTLGLGLRPRRFFYQPPAGWRGVPDGLSAYWYPPDYPRRLACLTVFPAVAIAVPPASVSEAWLEDEVAGGFTLAGRGPAVALRTGRGLTGQRWQIRGALPSGRPVLRELVVCHGGPYQHSFVLEDGSPDRGLARGGYLDELIESAEPLGGPAPAPPPPDLAPARLLGHWAG